VVIDFSLRLIGSDQDFSRVDRAVDSCVDLVEQPLHNTPLFVRDLRGFYGNQWVGVEAQLLKFIPPCFKVTLA
jgi:hypothetical protein